MYRVSVSIAIIALAAATASATAQSVGAPYGARERRATAARAGAPQRTCRPLCVADVTPCDPPEYKAADGRCADEFWRF